MKKKIKQVSGSKFVYTGKPSELNQHGSGVYATVILLVAIVAIAAGIARALS